MADNTDPLIKRVCTTFPQVFGVEGGEGGAPVKYYLDSVLGSGVSGTVIAARRVRDQHPFAIKVMDTDGLSAEDRIRASGEVCCLLSCDFFSIIKCHEDFVQKDSSAPDAVRMMALVLDYADAGDLRQEIRTRARVGQAFAEHEAGLLFIQILLAVHHVHSKHMIHRDIKSANILLCSNGLVKLGDFGFSKMYAATVSDDVGRTFCGTPYYVAPEIWRRKPYSKKADMFSLGVLLYELLTLQRPFDGAGVEEVMAASLSGKYKPLDDSFSPEMKHVVQWLLSPEPKKRPSSKTLLNTAFCKLYMSVVQEIVQGTSSDIPPEDRKILLKQLQNTKAELAMDRRPGFISMEEVLRGATPVSPGGKAVPTPAAGMRGLALWAGYLRKQASTLEWKNRYVVIYAEVPTTTPAPTTPQELRNLHLIQAVSPETIQQNCVATPFAQLEDVFPVISKYTGGHAEFAFAVIFLNGKRIIFDAASDKDRDDWMNSIQNLLGIGEYE